MSPTAPIPIPTGRNVNRSPSPRLNLHLQTSHQPLSLNSVRQELNGFIYNYKFIPRDGLDGLMTRRVVKEITMNLRLNDPSRPLHANTLLYEEDYTRVHEKYRVILAILIKLSFEDQFVKFHNYDNAYDDSRLPFSKEELEHIDPQRVICDIFLRTQYEFIPQIISGRHSWTPEFILPFIRKDDIGQGGYAKVYKVEIYPLYDNIGGSHCSNGQNHIYALKQLQESDEDDFILETHAGRLLGKRRHPNLLPLLAYFKHGSTFNMIFPHADCDLLKYYETQTPPRPATKRYLFMTRIQALTSALKAMHMGDSDQQSETLVGYHRDLKPQNILLINDKFMIADFGLTLFRKRNLDEQEGSGVGWRLGGSTYWAPECSTLGRAIAMVGRAGDVWSLGCIFADVITFVVRGYEGVCAFREHRTTVSAASSRVTKDWFHDEGHVKPTVLDWFQSLVDSTSGDSFVEEFIHLLKKILQSRPEDRPKITDIESEFQEILRREETRLNAGVSTTTNTTNEESIAPRRRAHSNALTPDPLALHCRSHSAPGFDFHDRDDQGLTSELLLPASRYSASPQMIQQRSSSGSMRGPTDPQTPTRLNHGQYLQERLSPESAAYYSNFVISPLPPLPTVFPPVPGSDRRLSLASQACTRSANDPLKPLKCLQEFDTVFLIDDSEYIGDRWPAMKRSLERFANLATQYDTDGIDLAFIHSKSKHKGITSERLGWLMAMIEAETVPNERSGRTMSMSLDEHLSEYTRKCKERMDRSLSQKYLNLIVLTSGDPGYLDDFEDKVLNYARKLDDMIAPTSQLGIQFALIQSSLEDQERFKRLDDQEFGQDTKKYVRDIVDATAYDPDTDNDDPKKLVKVLCGAINRRIDNSEYTPETPLFTLQAGSVNALGSRKLVHYEPTAQMSFSCVAPETQPVPNRNMSGSANGDNGGIGGHGLGILSNPTMPADPTTAPTAQPFANGGEMESGESKSQLPATGESKASDSVMSTIPLTTPPEQSFVNSGKKDSGESISQPLAASPPNSYSWSDTYPAAIAVATLACIVLYFIVT